jgi:hypothetical protein
MRKKKIYINSSEKDLKIALLEFSDKFCDFACNNSGWYRFIGLIT